MLHLRTRTTQIHIQIHTRTFSGIICTKLCVCVTCEQTHTHTKNTHERTLHALVGACESFYTHRADRCVSNLINRPAVTSAYDNGSALEQIKVDRLISSNSSDATQLSHKTQRAWLKRCCQTNKQNSRETISRTRRYHQNDSVIRGAHVRYTRKI